MENHPFLWMRIRRVRRIQVCMARKGLSDPDWAVIIILCSQLTSVWNVWLKYFVRDWWAGNKEL